jgi:hypothetical protein
MEGRAADVFVVVLFCDTAVAGVDFRTIRDGIGFR